MRKSIVPFLLLVILVVSVFAAIVPSLASAQNSPIISNGQAYAQQNYLTLPAGGQAYIYAFSDGGRYKTTGFQHGELYSFTIPAADGQVADGIAITASNTNSYTTSDHAYSIVGAEISGYSSYTTFEGDSGSNTDATTASVTFTVSAANSLVVIVALASAQSNLILSGLTLTVAAKSVIYPGDTDPVEIAYDYLSPGTYTVTETTYPTCTDGCEIGAATDLMGAFVFSPIENTVTFTESGLPSAFVWYNPWTWFNSVPSWSVTVDQTNTKSSTSNTIEFTLPEGPHQYSVSNSLASGNTYVPSPASGPINVAGSDISKDIAFTLNVPQTPTSFSIYWITDTQYLTTSDGAQYFNDLTNWTVNNIKEYNLRMVIHTGDIINDASNPSLADSEWNNANTAMEILQENNIPYCWCAGNHDFLTSDEPSSGWNGNKYSAFNPSTFISNSYWLSNTSDGSSTAVHFSFDGYDFLIFDLEYNSPPSVFQWVNEQIAAVKQQSTNANYQVIIATHAYLDQYGRAAYADQNGNYYYIDNNGNPQPINNYATSYPPPPSQEFLTSFQNLVDTPSNHVILTLNGHYWSEVDPSGYYYSTGNAYEMFFNRQGIDGGLGAASVTILTFDIANNQLITKTWDINSNNGNGGFLTYEFNSQYGNNYYQNPYTLVLPWPPTSLTSTTSNGNWLSGISNWFITAIENGWNWLTHLF